MSKDQGATENDKKDLPNGDDVVGTGNDARLKLMTQINDQNDAASAKNGDLADVNDDGTTGTFSASEEKDAGDEDKDEAARIAAEKTTQESAQKKEPEEKSEKYKIKVNGRELELTQQELIERAQKVEAADEYLKDAAKKLREAEEKTTSADAQLSKDVVDAELEERRALVRAIQIGTEEEAMAAIEKLQSRTVPSVSADDVARKVDERLTFNEAVSRFQTEYKDLVADPVLFGIVLQRDKDLLAQGDKRGYWERYEAVGKEVRVWKEQMVKSAAPSEPQKPENSKETRKAAAPAVPQGASMKAPAAVDDEDKEESVGEIISAMAKQRGGPQWLRG